MLGDRDEVDANSPLTATTCAKLMVSMSMLMEGAPPQTASLPSLMRKRRQYSAPK
ncbi:hypothetical protein ROE7235_03359 [Roseibaca ekhonensis]|jgi:hypothetical protein|uniref:Uncharacterized protein n=1 Tax=Roseinatronobacter ekhonensis TaxID=254356 RepID=A0A3B0MRE2_9RHOB|nr:hypothetical protein ROE7235_03359 [Roseibaca ekhonensis]